MNDRPEARNLGNQEAMDALIEALMVVGGTVLLARLVGEDRAMKLRQLAARSRLEKL